MGYNHSEGEQNLFFIDGDNYFGHCVLNLYILLAEDHR